MDKPIMITPQEIISTILALCGAIITISAAMTVIIKVIDKLRQPNKKQDERLDKVEQDIKALKERYREGNHDVYLYTKQVEEFESSQSETNRIIIEGLQALIAHALNGNDLDALKESKHQLDRYLLTKATGKEE